MPAVTFTTTGALGKSALRQANERLVLNAIRQNAGVSRADIGRITGLSPSSVTFIVKRLKCDKLVGEEKTAAPSQVGRQPTALYIHQDAHVALGIDLTLAGAQIALTDLGAKILKRKTVPWHANSDAFFHKVNVAIRSLTDPLPSGQLLGAGVAIPGFIDRASGRVIAAENFNWFDVDAGRLLRRDLTFPFWFENTAKLSALAEMWTSDSDPRPPRTAGSARVSSSTDKSCREPYQLHRNSATLSCIPTADAASAAIPDAGSSTHPTLHFPVYTAKRAATRRARRRKRPMW